MDEMTAFERQIAGLVRQAIGSPRPVDPMPIVRAASTTAPPWRFMPIFTALRFVVASAIVALVGGFLLVAQPVEQQRATGPGARPGPVLDVRDLEWAPLELDEATFGSGARLEAVAASDAMIVVGGSVDGSAAIWTSTDRVDWTRVPHDEEVFGGPADQEIKAIVPWREGFVAAGEAHGASDEDPQTVAAVWVSADGTTWTRVPHDEEVLGGVGRQEVRDIAATEDRLVIVGFDEEGPEAGDDDDIAVWTSTDGFVWTEETFGGGEMFAVAETSAGFLSVGNRGVWRSTDGVQWELAAAMNRPGFLLGVATTPRGYVVVGEEGEPVVWTSPDGVTWSRATIDGLPDDGVGLVRAVATADSGLAAVAGPGDTGGDSAILVSSDGKAWVQGNVTEGVADAGLRGIAAIGSHFVAIGNAFIPDAPIRIPTIWTTLHPQ